MATKAAVVFEKSGQFSIEQLQISEPNDDEVLVRITGDTLCLFGNMPSSLLKIGTPDEVKKY